jgi:hypothetical protein
VHQPQLGPGLSLRDSPDADGPEQTPPDSVLDGSRPDAWRCLAIQDAGKPAGTTGYR